MKATEKDERQYEQALWLELPQTQRHLAEMCKRANAAFTALKRACHDTIDPKVAFYYSQWKTYSDAYADLKGTGKDAE